MLGLVALTWCLLVAPVLHRETHSHGTKHAHQGPGDSRESRDSRESHGSGSFEHFAVSFVAPGEVVVGARVVVAMGEQPGVGQVAPSVRGLRRVEMSQAP